MNDEQQIIEPVPTMAGYKKIPTFKLWIANQFPYIETDFDAITNYELLQAVIKYLNTIIENENNVESNVTALYNAFVNLHDYVENYFDNLDVQEEINNKLDEMVDDGTIESILLNYSQVAKVFDTYNDMMLDTSTYVNGMKLNTLGYHYINDGGGSDYIVTNVQSDTKYQISIGTNLWIELIVNDYITPEVLGAYGDNEHDDTAVLQNILSNEYYKHVVLSKKYKISQGLSVANYKIIDGGGYIYSEGECFSLDGCARIIIRDLKLFPTTNAIHITSTNRWTNYNIFEDIYCYGNNTADKGLFIEPTTNYINEQTYRNCSFMNFKYGIYAENNTVNKEMSSHKFYDCSTEGSQILGQYIKKGDLFSFINCRHAETISCKWKTEGPCSSLIILGGMVIANNVDNIDFSSDTYGMMIGNLRYNNIYVTSPVRSANIIKGVIVPTLDSTTYDRVNISEDTTIDPMTSIIYHFFNFNVDNQCTLTLSPDLYGGQGKINEFFVRIANKTNNTTTISIGNYSKTLPAGSDDRYRFTYSTLTSSTGSWLVEKITTI